MAKRLSSVIRIDPNLGRTKRKDPHKPKNKNKLRSYKKYRGQGK